MFMTWLYNGEEFTSDQIGNYVGFVYEITNNDNGKRYIGKKHFYASKTVQQNKKKKRVRVESDWKSYWGSNDLLLEHVRDLGEAALTRRILRLCSTKGEMSYYEIKEQLAVDALIRDDYYNTFVGCKIHRKHMPKKT